MATYKGAASEAGRAINLIKKRQKEQEETEAKKKKIEEELKIGAISNKFAAHYDAIEQTLKSNTIGLVTLTEMRAKQESVVKERERQLAKKNAEARLMEQQKEDKKRKEQRKITMLSFDLEDDVEDSENDDDDINMEVKETTGEKKEFVIEESATQDSKLTEGSDNKSTEGSDSRPTEGSDSRPTEGSDSKLTETSDSKPTEKSDSRPTEGSDEKMSSDEEEDWRVQAANRLQKKKKRFGMNPEVDTSFLPDRDRDEEENRLRERIQMEWESRQASIKNEEIEITYSYWDGSGHRRQARMKKGNSIQQFLHKCLEALRREFNDLKSVTVDQLMYVKEDLIIPHHYLFYDFIVTKARGKSGPLFNFDAHEDIRVISDARIEKDESHAGKVCLRSWYERNKHIFPASRWEPYDPEKKWDNYSISDKNAAKITVK